MTERPQESLVEVSRETAERLRRYQDLLLHWTTRINLIAPSTRQDAWRRHIVDSMQLWPHAPPWAQTWIDLGSGGGLPGIVIAILAAEERPDLRVTIVESDYRKVAFLRHCAAQLELAIELLPRRVENIPRRTYDIVSARALAPLPRLLELCGPLRHDRTLCFFPKGKSAHSELTEARRDWHIDCEEVPSLTDTNGTILKIFEVGPRT